MKSFVGFEEPGLLLGLLAMASVLLLHQALREAEKAVRQLADPYWGSGPRDGIQEWQVTLDIVQEGVATGTDSGKIWVDNRTIYFAGRRTSFVLSRWQLANGFAVKSHQLPLRPIQRSIEIELAPLDPVERWSVQIDPRDTDSGVRLTKVLKEASTDPDPFQLGQFPPRSIGPGSVSRKRLISALLRSVFSVGTPVLAVSLILPITLLRHLGKPWHASEWAVLVLYGLMWLGLVLSKILVAVRALGSYGAVMKRVTSLAVGGTLE